MQPLLDILKFRDGMSILEVGCGTGAFSFALKRWLPNLKITGVDRDTEFIRYAKMKSNELSHKCTFIQGDATNLNFPDNYFDATTSHTVLEHVETSKFLSEQYRVLKTSGVFTVLTVRDHLSVGKELSKAGSAEEKVLWDKVAPCFKDSDRKYDVAKYSVNESDLARKMVKTGFQDVTINFLVIHLIPDNADTDAVLAKSIIETERQIALGGVLVAQKLAPGVLSETEIEHLRFLINSRFDNRIHLYEKGEKSWDVSASVLMIARGIK
jgi:ubiquinone/menaquinone biosynthesis C-methylase UbiE